MFTLTHVKLICKLNFLYVCTFVFVCACVQACMSHTLILTQKSIEGVEFPETGVPGHS